MSFTDRDFLTADGIHMKNRDGETVMLRGTNFGGWLLREGWMDGAGMCLAELEPERVTRRENYIAFDFGKAVRWNRFIIGDHAVGSYSVYSSEDGDIWTEVGTADFTEFDGPVRDDTRPTAYDIKGLNDTRFYFWQGQMHMQEMKTRYAKIEFEQVPVKVIPARYGDISDYESRRVLEERFGRDEADEMIAAYQKAFITEWDLDYVKGLGFNLVRIPIYWQEIMDKNKKIKADAFEDLDWLMEKCREKEIYVMPDFHGSPGGHVMGSITGGELDSNSLWYREEYQEMDREIWRAIANRYLGDPVIAAYDLLNEPMPNLSGTEDIGEGFAGLRQFQDPVAVNTNVPEFMNQQVREFYDSLYKTVKEIDTEHVICFQFFQDFNMLGDPGDYEWENFMIQTHTYGIPTWRDHDGQLIFMRKVIEKHEEAIAKWQVPFFAGEFNFWGFYDIWAEWLDTLNKMEIGWANWSYKISDTNVQDSWSLLYDYNGQFANFYTDSKEEILKKYKNFTSDNYKINKELEEVMRKYAGV